MTVTFTNSPNITLVATVLAKLFAEKGGGEVAEVKVERREASENQSEA